MRKQKRGKSKRNLVLSVGFDVLALLCVLVGAGLIHFGARELGLYLVIGSVVLFSMGTRYINRLS